MNQLTITHNTAANCFEVIIDGLPSRLDYIENADSFVITHVGVHPVLRGQGVAGQITQAALKYAKSKALRVIPICSYASAYIRRNPQYIELTRKRE